MSTIQNKNKFINRLSSFSSSFLWDLWCIVSIVGIWPRYIEPKLIDKHRLSLTVKNLPPSLNQLRIIQFSDLHLNSNLSDRFLAKLQKKINESDPDLILFTGDFLCFSQFNDPNRLESFFSSLKARYGCFASLGNHDYAQCVSINNSGDYDVLTDENRDHPLKRAFSRLFKKNSLTNRITPRAQSVAIHQDLVNLLAKTPFKLLHNETILLPIKESYLNICGLGEYMAGRFLPEIAFKNYHRDYPGIILSHNPDTAAKLRNYPGDIILSGHTHGGQVNLPWMWKRFTLLENMRFKKGLWPIGDKWLYVNRGIGSILNFRWFAMPEVLLLILRTSDGSK